MPLTKFQELPDAEELTQYPATRRTVYLAVGEDDARLVEAQSLALVPQNYLSNHGVLYRQPLAVRRLGFQTHEVDVLYGPRPWSPLEWTIRGRTTGGTQKILSSFETIAKSENAPDFKGLIGYDPTSQTVEGVDVPVPVLEFSIDIKYPAGHVNNIFMNALANLTGKVNSVPWLGRAAGEVLYQGAEFGDGTTTEMECSHLVAISPNLSNFTSAGLTITAKDGWDFLWLLTEEHVHDGPPRFAVQRAVHWYVERTLKRADFKATLGFGYG